MIPFPVVNGQADSGLDSLVAPSPMNGTDYPSRPGPPIETGDNGNAQIDANERPLRLGPPIETGVNGNAQIDANERRLRLGPRLPNGDNGESTKNSPLGPPSRDGDNGYMTVCATVSGVWHRYERVVTAMRRLRQMSADCASDHR
jgi:hypothetical protein